MPEGDTIFRTAARLRPVLVGRSIEAARARDPLFPAGTLVGRTIAAVEARGKHLLTHLDDACTIHSHLGMHGSWHWYPPGEPWQKDRWLAALASGYHRPALPAGCEAEPRKQDPAITADEYSSADGLVRPSHRSPPMRRRR